MDERASARWAKRDTLANEFLSENSHEQLIALTSKAKLPLVHSIREQWKARAWISERQARVLAGWLADEELEFSGEEE